MGKAEEGYIIQARSSLSILFFIYDIIMTLSRYRFGVENFQNDCIRGKTAAIGADVRRGEKKAEKLGF